MRPMATGGRILFIGLALLLAAGSSLATEYYVSNGGNDSNDGRSSGSAFRTIQRCADVAQAGDTCNIAAGSYSENSITPVNAGTPGSWITFAGPAGSGGDKSCDHTWNGNSWNACTSPVNAAFVQSSNWNFTLTRDKNYIRIKDMRLANGVYIINASNVEVLDSVVYCDNAAGCGGPGQFRVLNSDHVLIENVLMWDEENYTADTGNGPTVEKTDYITLRNSTLHNARNAFQWRYVSHALFDGVTIYDIGNHPGDIWGSDYVTIRNFTRYKTHSLINSLAGSCIPDIYCTDNVVIDGVHCVGADFTENADRDMPYAWSISSTARSSDAVHNKCIADARDVDGDDGYHCNYTTPAPYHNNTCTPATADQDCPGASSASVPKCVDDRVVSEHLTVTNVNAYWAKYGCFKITDRTVRWATVSMHHNNCYGPQHDSDGDGRLEAGECVGPSGKWERYFDGDTADLDGDGCPNMLADWKLLDWDNDGTPGGPPVRGYTLGEGSTAMDSRMIDPTDGIPPYDFSYPSNGPLIDAGNPDIDLDGQEEIQPGGDDECVAASGCAGQRRDIGAQRYEYGLAGGIPGQCEDGLDNDGDGAIDGSDSGCDSPSDTSEKGWTACDDGLDNDGDGAVDFQTAGGDPGCSSASDDSEREAGGPACDNGVDDDGDGATDFPADYGCTGAADAAELGSTQCGDGVDNSDPEDSLADQDDPGCAGPADDDESNQPDTGGSGTHIACTEDAFEQVLANCSDGDTITFDCSDTTILLSSSRAANRKVQCDNVTIDGEDRNIVFEMDPPWWDDMPTACGGSNCDPDGDGSPDTCPTNLALTVFLDLEAQNIVVKNLAYNYFWEGIHFRIGSDGSSLDNVSCKKPGDDCASNFGPGSGGSGGAQGLSIRNSTFSLACDKGIQIYGSENAGSSAWDWTISGNTFSNAGQPIRGDDSVAGRFLIENNVFEGDNPPKAIYACNGPRFDGPGQIVYWKNNEVRNCRRGLRIDGGAQLVSQGGNLFRDNDIRGALIRGNGRALFQNDTFQNNGGSSSSGAEASYGGLAAVESAAVDAGGGTITLDGQSMSSAGGNVFNGNRGPSDSTLNVHNQTSSTVKAECNTWNDADPSDEIDGNVDYSPLASQCAGGSEPPSTPGNLRRTDTQ